MTEKKWKRPTIRTVTPKQKDMDYTMVRFRNPGHKGETWHVSVSGRGGPNWNTPNAKHRMVSEVTQTVTGRYAVYTLAEFDEMVFKKDPHDPIPNAVYHRLFKRAEAFCKKHGFVNVDPRWKK